MIHGTEPKRLEFFNRWAKIRKPLFLLGVLGQILSFTTEVMPIFGMTAQAFKFMPVFKIPFTEYEFSGITFFASTAAILVALLIEGGIRVTAPKSFELLYESLSNERHKQAQVKKYSVIDNILTGFTVLFCVLLVCSGAYLSFTGSTDSVEVLTEQVVEIDPQPAIDSVSNVVRARATERWQIDSVKVSQTFDVELAAIRVAGDNLAAAKDAKAQSYIDRPNGSERYPTQIGRYKAEAAAIRGDYAQKIASKESEKAAAVTAAYDAYLAGLDKALLDAEREGEAIAMANTKLHKDRDILVRSSGKGLGWVTLIFMFITILSIGVDSGIKYGSGEGEAVHMGSFDYHPGLLSYWWYAAKESFLNNQFRKVVDKLDKIQANPVATIYRERVDLSKLTKAPSLTVTVDNSNDKAAYLNVLRAVEPEVEEVKEEERKIGFRVAAVTEPGPIRDESTIKRVTPKAKCDTDENKRGTELPKCVVCFGDIKGKRSDAKTCSDTCRTKLSRMSSEQKTALLSRYNDIVK